MKWTICSCWAPRGLSNTFHLCRLTGTCTTCASPTMSCWMWWLDSRPRWWRAWAETRTPRQQWKCCRRSCARCLMAQVSPPAPAQHGCFSKLSCCQYSRIAQQRHRAPSDSGLLPISLRKQVCILSLGKCWQRIFFLAPGGFWPSTACLGKEPSKCSGTASPICS